MLAVYYGQLVVDKENMKDLKHIAFIMDGNGRWAKQRLMPRKFGHSEGVKAMKRVIDAASEYGIEAVSFYAFSTENWSRPQDEVDTLFKMVDKFARDELEYYAEKGYRVRIMGDLSRLPESTAGALQRVIERTANNTGLTVNIGLNYGGRDEIIRAVNKIVDSGEAVTMDSLNANLDTAGMSDPDVIVRSAGEQRLSNFMLWQAAYSEFIFRKEYWPSFDKNILKDIIDEYSTRDRRFGKIKDNK